MPPHPHPSSPLSFLSGSMRTGDSKAMAFFFFFLTKQGKRGGGGKRGEAQANLVLTAGPPWMAEMSQLTAAMLNTRLPNLGRAF